MNSVWYGSYESCQLIFLQYRHGASCMTVQYLHGASCLTVLYSHGASCVTVLYLHIITTKYYSIASNNCREWLSNGWISHEHRRTNSFTPNICTCIHSLPCHGWSWQIDSIQESDQHGEDALPGPAGSACPIEPSGVHADIEEVFNFGNAFQNDNSTPLIFTCYWNHYFEQHLQREWSSKNTHTKTSH